jgi:hypothetical protein
MGRGFKAVWSDNNEDRYTGGGSLTVIVQAKSA